SPLSLRSTSLFSCGSLPLDIFRLLSQLVNAKPDRSERRSVNCARVRHLQEQGLAALLVRRPLEQDHPISALTGSQAPRAEPEVLNRQLLGTGPTRVPQLAVLARAAQLALW